MKDFLLLTTLLFFLAVPVTAQNEEPIEEIDQAINYLDRNVNFGLRGGLNFSSFNDDQVLNADLMSGLHIGVFGRFRISRYLAAKAELIYSMQGARADEFAIFENYAVNLDYLKIPILGEFIFGNKFVVELGPYFGFLLDSRQSFKQLEPINGDFNVSEDDTNTVDIGFAVGGIYYFNQQWGAGIRYNQGFADALGDDFFQGASGANTVLQLSMLYHFR
ncbi:MAG: porin family protein [Candidatus Cyclobacteriaceae bacterium M3_2C_046]